LLVEQQLAIHGTVVLPLLYTLDPVLCDFYFFAWMKDIHFKDAADVQVASKTVWQEAAHGCF
jgi:hypothetical protein